MCILVDYHDKWKNIYDEDFIDYDAWLKDKIKQYRDQRGLEKGETIDLDKFTKFLEIEAERAS